MRRQKLLRMIKNATMAENEAKTTNCGKEKKSGKKCTLFLSVLLCLENVFEEPHVQMQEILLNTCIRHAHFAFAILPQNYTNAQKKF